jgi:GxxExxY protein
MKHRELTAKIIDCAYKVHRELGFGFLESVYQNALVILVIELTKADLKVEQEKKVPVSYDGQVIGDFTADVVVEEKIILELKSVKQLHAAHEAQVINYLKATGIEVGLLINFGETVEIKRKVLDHP